jgi:ACS family glucarate transporter-like MFS transporter
MIGVQPQTAPSAIRWRIARLLLVITTLTFIDRFNMSVASKYIQQEFQLSNLQVGTLLSAFVLGYALFQIPGGMLGDQFGPRRMLLWAVIWWSGFTALTAAAPELFLARWIGVAWSLWIVRFLIGCGEAPAFPNANKVIGMWMPPDELARGNSMFIVGVGIGGTFTPPAIAYTMAHYGWRVCFVACGALGLVVAAAWYCYSTERPEQHPGVNAAELGRIGAGKEIPRTTFRAPWRRILSSRNVWALVFSNAMLGYVTAIFYFWFYLYVVNVRKLQVMNASYWSTAPFVVMLFSVPLGGFVSDWMVRKIGHPWGRRLPVFAGSALSCLCLLAGARIGNPYLAICTLARCRMQYLSFGLLLGAAE